MAITTVHFNSRDFAEALPADPRIAVISITDPGTPQAALADGFHAVLRMSFLDAVPGDEFCAIGIPYIFSTAHAREVDDFVCSLMDHPVVDTILVHCEFGVSRSAACAAFVRAATGARLADPDRMNKANPWVVGVLSSIRPDLDVWEHVPPAPVRSHGHP